VNFYNDCQLADRKLSSLKILDLNSLNIADVKPLASLNKLKELDLRITATEEICPVKRAICKFGSAGMGI
jgi:Leucine-rich repeat (LRR) protein